MDPNGEMPEPNVGYSHYKLNLNGELIFAKGIYMSFSGEESRVYVQDVLMSPDNSFLAEMGYSGTTSNRHISYFDVYGLKISELFGYRCDDYAFVYNEDDESLFTVINFNNSLKLVVSDLNKDVFFEKDFSQGIFYTYRNSQLIKCNDGGYLYRNGFTNENNEGVDGIYLSKMDKDKNTPIDINF